MTYNIETESDLTKALKECKDGDRISGICDISSPLVCDKIIEFSMFRLVSKYRERFTPEKHKAALTIIKGATFDTGSVWGEPLVSPTTWQNDGLQTLIKGDGASFLMFNNFNIRHGNYIGLWAFDCKMTSVSMGNISDHATPKEGYGFGYGIWQGGKGNAKDQVLNVSNCSFENNRHCIAGSKHPNHIYVTGCNFKGGQYSQHILDRHGENGIGGGNYYIFGNTFEAPDRFAYDLAKPVTGQILIEGNTFARPEANGRIGGLVYSGNTNNLAE